MRYSSREMRRLLLIVFGLLSMFLLGTTCYMDLVTSVHSLSKLFSIVPPSYRTEDQVSALTIDKSPPSVPQTPSFAYLISGSKGDLEKLWRTLVVIYHPLNQYIIHMDLESPLEERMELSSRVEYHPLFESVGNVYMITKADLITYRGPTMVSSMLHACAILLKRNKNWNWFINLSPSDYPLVTQDDLLHAFTNLNRSINFLSHTSQLGWKAEARGKPVIVDPGLYREKKQKTFWLPARRDLPTAFKLFTGSGWMVLSRSFVEYLIWGWDNLPRTLLMYFANFDNASESYFQTALCNAPEYIPTVINHDLHFISWDVPAKQHPRDLSINDMPQMIQSNAAFARKFRKDDPIMDLIDKDLLGRRNGSFTPGGWCAGNPPCSRVGNPYKIQPGPGAGRLRLLLDGLTPQKDNKCS